MNPVPSMCAHPLPTRLAIFAAGLIGLSVPLPAQTTVLADPFTGGSSVLTYANLTGITAQAVAPDADLGSEARQVTAGNLSVLLALLPSAVSLGGNTGDYVRLAFDFRTESTPSGYLRFGLFNSAGTLYSSANGDDTGYYADFGYSTGSRQAWYATGGPAYYLSVGNPATSAPGTSIQRQLTTVAPVTFQLQLTRTETGATFTVHRGTLVSGPTTLVYSLDHATPVTSFDEFAIFSQSARTYWIDDVTLTTGSAIPEPSAYAAAAGVLALGLAWRRRRG